MAAVPQVRLRFYEELNDFLPPPWRKTEFTWPLNRRGSIKDLIEGLGVPHTEVDLILVDGEPVSFAHIVVADERISVYPLFESLDIGGLARLRPEPLRSLRPPRFICDVHLGRLARYLRLAGFDTLWRNDYADAELAELSAAQRRVLLTRDRRLLQRRIVTHGVFIRSTQARQQLADLCQRLDLLPLFQPLTRCPRCNGRLAAVDKAAIAHRLAPKTRRYYHRFSRCDTCGQPYWQGSHHRRISRLLTLSGQP